MPRDDPQRSPTAPALAYLPAPRRFFLRPQHLTRLSAFPWAARWCSGPNRTPLSLSGHICLMINGEAALKVTSESQANTSCNGCSPLPVHPESHFCVGAGVCGAGPTIVS
jgi:hypothetical protein